MGKTIVILQSNYIPWKGYFDLIHDADTFVFYDEVQYTKNDWRNRNQLCAHNGPFWLTIPVAKDAVHMKISEVPLPTGNWLEQHYKSIFYTYKSAKHFSQLEPLLNEFYKTPNLTGLSSFNQAITRKICEMLGITTQLIDSKELNLEGDKVNRLVQAIRLLGGTDYLSGPSGKDYIEESRSVFSESGIAVHYKDYSGYPEYPQFKPPFTHAVSILDMIAHLPLAVIPDYIWGGRAR